MITNYATQYQKALANEFPKVLHFGALWQGSNKDRYKPVDAKTIKIPTIQTKGRRDGDVDTIGSITKGHENDWETKMLENHREWTTFVHPTDIMRTGGILDIANITKAFNEQQKFKEMDCYVASKLYADFIALGEAAKTTTLTTDNILSEIDKIMEAMDEAFVPASGRVLYVTAKINTIIKNAKDLQRYLSATEKEITRTINRIEELTIESIPSLLMKTQYDFTEGAVAGAGAKQINMMCLHPDAVLPVQQYQTAMLQEPTTLSKGKYCYFEEAFEDIFILNKRKDALAFYTEA